jgi:type IV secretion system protein VirB10
VSSSRPEPPEESATPGPAGRPDEPPADETQRAGGTSAHIPGERGIPSVNRTRSVQSRVTVVLTMMLVVGLTAGFMVWYYAGALSRGAADQERADAAARRRAQGESTLPSLGTIRPPKGLFDRNDSILDRVIPPPPALPTTPAAEGPIAPANPYAQSELPKKTPAELAQERRLGGQVFSSGPNDRQGGSAPSSDLTSGGDTGWAAAGAAGNDAGREEEGGNTLASLLRPTATPAVRAQMLPTQRFMLPKGAFIDCTLETAISSSLPGMTTCVTPTDTFSADGKVVLLERGTKLVGETRGQVQGGRPRLFVLWTEARTPTGVIVPLASPGTDELGRSGLTGTIDRHWLLRFGDAILITVIDGLVQAASESRGTNNSITLNPSTSGDVVEEVLRDSLRIRPTIEKAQGDRIQVFVARYVDFRPVYQLTASPGDPQ